MPTGLVAAQPVRSTFTSLTTDGSGALWWTGPGVTRYDPATGALRTFTVADDAAFGDVRALAPSQPGGVWLVTSTALLLFDGQRFEHVVATPASMAEVAVAPDGTVWTATDDTRGAGVWSWNGSTWRRLPSSGPGSAVYPLTVDMLGRVWVGDIDYPGPVSRGVSMWNGRSWTTFSPDRIPLSGAYPLSITATADGSVWLGGDTSAVARYSGHRWTGFTQGQTGMTSIQSIAQEPGGAVWFGGGTTSADGTTAPADPVVVARFDDSGWTRYRASDGLRAIGANPTAEVTVADGTVWAGTDQGLFTFTGRGWRNVLANPPGPDSPRGPVLARSADDVWVVDAGTGLLWHHASAGWSTPARTGRLAGHVVTAALGADGTLWVGTDVGLTRLDATGWTDAGPGEPIAGVTVAPDGTVWAGSAGQSSQLMHLDGDRVLTAVSSPKVGLTNLAIGPDGDVWGTGFGFTESVGPTRLHGGTMQTTTPIAGTPATATSVTVAPNGDIWTSLLIPVPGKTDQEAALARYDGHTWTVYRDIGFGTWDRPQLTVGPDGTVYAASAWGLFSFDGSTWTKRLTGHWLAVSAAADGTLWLTGDAVYRLPSGALDR